MEHWQLIDKVCLTEIDKHTTDPVYDGVEKCRSTNMMSPITQIQFVIYSEIAMYSMCPKAPTISTTWTSVNKV